jgi:hypothetical protein
MNPGDPIGGSGAEALTPLELALGRGDAASQAEARASIAGDPEAALAMAEAVMLVQQLRDLRTTPSRRYDRLLDGLVQRAAVRMAPVERPWSRLALAAAAAVLAFAGLRWWDPLRCERADVGDRVRLVVAPPREPVVPLREPVAELLAEPLAAVPVVHELDDVVFADTVDCMRRHLEGMPTPYLRDALEQGLRATPRLDRWLEPRNLLARAQVAHARRAEPLVRQGELARRGGLVDADHRAQQVADQVAALLQRALRAGQPLEVGAVSDAVQALVAAGPGGPARAEALAAGADWLAEGLPQWSGARLAVALAGLVDAAAASDRHVAATAHHGGRLVDEVLQRDGQNWERSLPELVGSKVSSGVLGECAALLRRLPGFEVDAHRAGIVRQLVLGQLRSRRVLGRERPEVLAALLYGCRDLLDEAERDELELQVLRWKPVRLAPDFATVRQQVWGFEPGRRGFTRLQAERRGLNVLATPDDLAAAAGLCLGLCADFAAFPADASSGLGVGD